MLGLQVPQDGGAQCGRHPVAQWSLFRESVVVMLILTPSQSPYFRLGLKVVRISTSALDIEKACHELASLSDAESQSAGCGTAMTDLACSRCL